MPLPDQSQFDDDCEFEVFAGKNFPKLVIPAGEMISSAIARNYLTRKGKGPSRVRVKPLLEDSSPSSDPPPRDAKA